MAHRDHAFRNGLRVTVGPCWAVTTLPTGETIHAHPDGTQAQAEAARAMGYPDVCALTRDHDLLHAALCDWLGLPGSFALAQAAGRAADAELAGLEEEAVLAVQRFMRRAGGRVPTS